MNELFDNSNLAFLLNQYQSMGGIVEHVVLDRDSAGEQGVPLHRQAALRTLEILGRRLDEYFERLLQSKDYKHFQRDNFFRVEARPELLSGHQISLSEFLGPCFNLEKRCLLLRGQTKQNLNNYFHAGDAEVSRNALPHPPLTTGFTTNGYAGAFSEPPYSMSGTHKDINALFLSIANELFCDFHCSLQIYQWSTDWSNYFDAGHEWWGSFLWTVEPEGVNYIVGIAASSTD